MDNKRQHPEQPSARNQPHSTGNAPRNDVERAHREADKDIAQDPDFSAKSPNDDLDEGETARLGENNTGLI